jgi:cytidyltransferase-like protein
MENKVITIASGYFNPVHVGHIELFNNAKSISDTLIVIINNDKQRELKGSRKFLNEEDRVEIVKNLKPVDRVVLSIDEDRSVRSTIKQIYNKYSEGPNTKFIFVNGGDQFSVSVAEREVCQSLGIFMMDGLGGKIRSSSEIIKNSEEDLNQF